MSVRIPGLLAAMLLLPSLSIGQGLPAGYSTTTVTTGFNFAPSMTFAPDGRLFVCDRTNGEVHVVKDGVLDPTPWHDFTNVNGSSGSERGLLSQAVHPDFLNNGWMYFYYTNNESGATDNHVVRLTEAGGAADPSSVTVIVNDIPSSSIHNSGQIAFGLDGKLYVTTGDKGTSSNGQNMNTLAGKMLRVNDDGSIPSDNPFVGTGGREEIWALGFRNHFGIAVHPVTGTVFTTENNPSNNGEVNRIIKGGNYGWNNVQGISGNPSFIDPIWDMDPDPEPLGATFYTGSNFDPGLTNSFFFIDWSGARLRMFVLTPPDISVANEMIFHDYAGTGFDVENGPDGNLWVLRDNSSFSRGGDRVEVITYGAAPSPALNLTAVTPMIIGGSLTIAVGAPAGSNSMVWVSAKALSPPLPPPGGSLSVDPTGAILLSMPPTPATGTNTAFLGVPVPAIDALQGAVIHAQGLAADPGFTSISLTNAVAQTLR